MVECSFDTLCNYFEKRDLPCDVADLLNSIYRLWNYHILALEGKDIPSFDNDMMLHEVAEVSQLIVRLGGVFYTESGSTFSREDKSGVHSVRDAAPTK
jgi:hypothetical protein